MEDERGNGEGKVVAVGLIEKATNSTRPEVEPRLLKAIKSVVRSSDSELRLAAQTLMSLMKRDHSQVRFLSLLIIDELFMRSKLFRTLIVENMDQLLTLAVGFRRNQPLPAPPSVASVLRSKAIEFLEKWNTSFGIHYRQLRLGFDYLKNTLRFQFPNLQTNVARIQQERREREMRTKELLNQKFDVLKTDFSSIKNEIQSTLDEICECLDIIVSTKDEKMPYAPLDDEEMEEFRSSELMQIRLDSLKEGEKVQENSENKVVFDALRELYKLLVMKHLTAVQEWISVLIRVDTDDIRFRDSALKEFIDIRNRLQSVRKKCEDSGCALPDTINHEEGEDIWEEGIIDASENVRSGMANKQSVNGSLNANRRRHEAPECSGKVSIESEKLDHEGGRTKSNPIRSKLLAEAPVIKWGSFLDNWGSHRDVLANQRGLELDNHWGRVDYDAVIPVKKIAELSVQATLYKEEPNDTQPCRAPLGKGGLCPRRDLKVCPFHGPIVDRDDEGNPIIWNSPKEEMTTTDLGPNLVELKEEMTPDLGSNLVEEFAKQAVKNVRARDKEEAKKREHDRQALKRAKLAKVREHNEAILRGAAIASTSRSSTIREDVGTASMETSSYKSKKETLASMLKKKVTNRDRLAQRLLNTRASDSTTRQLTMGEDANYREAFPNQW